ncbi:MAG: response regulator transcription factor [Anaerolineales bacterium]|jgi:DNA-binding NarL/FixJ family response regulator
MKILLADGGAAARFALCTLLEQQAGWCVVGELSSANQLEEQINQLKPDLLLLDWNLPEMKVELLVPCLKEKFSRLSIIVLSGRPELKSQACSAGADAFVSKADPPGRMLDTIRSIAVNI